MTPKNKAAELVEKYDETLTYLESKLKAKQCALIAVDEMIKIRNEIINTLKLGALNIEVIEFLEEVKQEIENL